MSGYYPGICFKMWKVALLMALFTALLLLAAPGTAGAGEAALPIPDENLEAAIRAELGKPEGGLTREDLEGMTSLDASWRGIGDLSGLEQAVNLEALNLWGNQVEDLSPLAGLQGLAWLDLEGNGARDIAPLAGLGNLRFLYLGNNRVGDPAPLGELGDLRWLELWGNGLGDISALAGLVSLEHLYLWDNRIEDLTPLGGLENLQYLVIWGNRVQDISPLRRLAGLQHLDIQNNLLDLREGSRARQDLDHILQNDIFVSYRVQQVKAWPAREGVAIHKSWTVKFSRPVDPGTVNDQGIYVLDSHGRRVNVRVSPGAGGDTALVEVVGNYWPGQGYTLHVSLDLRSTEGYRLLQHTYMDFSIQ